MSEKFVLLLRHGIAEKKGDKPDEKRRLTKKGNREMSRIAEGLARLLPKVDAIYSSPLIRAIETAAWVADAYDLGVTPTDALRNEATTEDVRQVIEESGAKRIILVGHEPSLSRHMLGLTGMRGIIELEKGGCYAIQEGRLVWMLPPDASP